MILSMLDNDLYKFTMQQAVHMLYPRAEAEYRFTNRGKTPFPDGFANELTVRVKEMANLSLSRSEKDFLKQVCYFLTPVYLDYLETYRFNPEEVEIFQEGTDLSVTVRGPWYRTILWEIPLMALISEIYFSTTSPTIRTREEIRRVNQTKGRALADNGVRFADFGTRRRYSSTNHYNLIEDLLSIQNSTMIGTSNVHLARHFNVTPIGTLAHEWFMFHGVMAGYQMANLAAQDAWVKVFQGDLGIALADTYTTDVFLSGFDTLNAKLFDGVRQDSGDPIEFMEKIIAHYKSLHIDPTTKSVVFSDSLDVDKAIEIHNACSGQIRDAYGIGTNLTNDVGVTPLNIVIKLSKCRAAPSRPWQHTVKLSDNPGKHTGDTTELNNCMRILNLTPA